MNFWKENRDHIYVAAHRSNSATHPENTVEAFQAAIAEGVDQIETDVRVTRDGELVLIHDATVDRTTNGTGKVIVEPWVSAGVKNEEGVDKMIARDATLVTCNNPEKILRLLRKKGKRQD